MEIILKQDVDNLGNKDQIVNVRPGYANNYLIPQGLAVIASDSALKRLAEDQRQRAHKIAKLLEEAQAAAAAIEGVKLTITAKTSATGTVFGSVGAAQVADALEKLGHVVDRKFIEVKNPVKEIGVYTATIRFHKEVAQEVEFEVVREEETAE